MVVIKYKKMNLGAFIGTEEMLDSWSRVFNRASIEFEDGFKFKLFHEAVIGVESEKEYLVVNTALTEDKLKSKIQELFPDWIEVVDCYECCALDDLEKFKTREVVEIDIDNFAANEKIILDTFLAYKTDGKIIDFKKMDNGVKVAVSSILSNIMCDIIDELEAKIHTKFIYTVIRKKLLLETENGLVEVDDYLYENAKIKYEN